MPDVHYLYKLLEIRDSVTNISHMNVPIFRDHVRYVASKPYTVWDMVYWEDKPVGSVYLTKANEIGRFINPDWQRQGLGKSVIKLVIEKYPRDRYLANINQDNKRSQKFFEGLGFKKIQHTYKLEV